MNNMINYIFETLSSNQRDIYKLNKSLGKQIKFNKTVNFYMCTFLIVSELKINACNKRIKDQEKEINKMKKELEELKRKGE